MNKSILNQYLICNQEMVASTNADQILLKLKLYLNACVDDLSMLYFSYTELPEPVLNIAAYINESDVTIESYEVTIADCASAHNNSEKRANNLLGSDVLSTLQKEVCQNSTSLISLFKNEKFNQDSELQKKAASCLGSVIKKSKFLSCFSACVPVIDNDTDSKRDNNVPPRKIWCLVICKKNKKNDSYFAKNSELILVLINLVFSHVSRIEALKKLKQENNWIQDELKKIATLQRQLLPEDDVEIKGVELAANFRACEHAGGDYYDFLSLTDIIDPESVPRHSDFWGTMIADSAGHGATAAVEISMFDAILRTMNHENSTMTEGPAGVFNYTNQYLFTRIIRGTFITSFVAAFNPDLEQITYACAGHPPPILFRSRSQDMIELDQSAGIPLGVVKDYVWENAIVPFKTNDMLLMYTDGILEANNANREQFGLQRLKNVLIEDLSLSCKEIVSKIEAAVDDFQQSNVRKDDQTLVILKRL